MTSIFGLVYPVDQAFSGVRIEAVDSDAKEQSTATWFGGKRFRVYVRFVADDHLAKLAALPTGVRRDLLRVLLAEPEVRADLIRQFYERQDARHLADVLMDLEADDVLRVEVIGLLEELEKLSG